MTAAWWHIVQQIAKIVFGQRFGHASIWPQRGGILWALPPGFKGLSSPSPVAA